MSAIEDIEKRREERRATTEKLRAEQYAKDLVEIDKLEEEYGPDRVKVLTTPSFVPGLPTVVVIRTPASDVFTRFRQMVRRSNGKIPEIGNARDLLAASVVVYPDAATYDRMKEQWPSVHDVVGHEAVKLGEAEGKD